VFKVIKNDGYIYSLFISYLIHMLYHFFIFRVMTSLVVLEMEANRKNPNISEVL
jgi:hypothetical protein